jgi:hypothetical protein
MASTNQVEVVFLKEFLELLSSEHESAASLIFFPVTSVFVGVIPEEVCYQSTIGYISGLRNLLNLLEAMHVFGDSTVHTHDLLVDQGYQRHVIKAIPECLPEGDLVSSLDLVEKSIDSGDSLGLVVTSQNNDLSRVSHLKGE